MYICDIGKNRKNVSWTLVLLECLEIEYPSAQSSLSQKVAFSAY